MTPRIFLSAVLLVALATPALADDPCGPLPAAPAVPDGKTASKDQILAARTDVTAFLKTSDQYQGCLKTYLDQKTQEAAKDKNSVDPSVKAGVLAKADSNQRDKVRVGNDFNKAVTAFNAAHPN